MTSSGKLNVLESERVIAILDDAIDKIKQLDSAKTDLLQYSNDLARTLGPDVSKSIRFHNIQEKQYNTLLEQRTEIKTTVDKRRYKEIQAEIQDLSRSLKESSTLLAKSLKENPTISRNTTKVSRDRTDLTDFLLRCTQELRDYRTYQSMILKVEDDEKHVKRLNDLKALEKTLRETVYNLQNKIQQEQQLLQNLNNTKKAEILQLRNEIHLIRTNAGTNSSFLRKETNASLSALYREFKLKEREIEIQIKEWTEKGTTESIVSQETKDFLIRKTVSLSEELKKWEVKSDMDIGQIDEEIKMATIERNKLLDKLVLLQQRKSQEIEEKENKIIQESQQYIEYVDKRSEEMRYNCAAKKIQLYIKQYLLHVKKHYTEKKKKSSDKKDGKGGDKKKSKK